MRTLAHRTLGMTRVVAHLIGGAATMAAVMPYADASRRRRIIEAWSRGVLDIFNMELRVRGTPPASTAAADRRPVLLVGNHISWLDIYAYLSVADVRFVAKSEVKAWPLIGWFARRLGTIFVERDRPRDAVRVGALIGEALAAGEMICVFPEGTTTDGSEVLPFSAVLLHPAVEAGAVVQPVSIAYRTLDGDPCRRAAFTGETTLVQSMWSMTSGARSVVELTFLEPVPADTADRRALAQTARSAIRRSLGHPTGPMAETPQSAAETSVAVCKSASNLQPTRQADLQT